jgi:hypothetical protein
MEAQTPPFLLQIVQSICTVPAIVRTHSADADSICSLGDPAVKPDSTKFMREKIKGITKHGKIYWLRTQQKGRLLQMSLETEDYVEAVKKAALILQTSELNPTQGLKADLQAFTSVVLRK